MTQEIPGEATSLHDSVLRYDNIFEGVVSTRGDAASIAVLRHAVLHSRPSGSTDKYFREQAQWEAKMRGGFASLAKFLAEDVSESVDQALIMLRYLNGAYRTRASVTQLGVLATEAVAAVRRLGWWTGKAPNLLEATNEEAYAVSNLVPAVLRKVSERGARKAYSLLTKFLHFVLPETFVIYDSQAANSIGMWSLFAFHDDVQSQRRFQVDRISSTTGKGYVELVDFYRTIWKSAPAEDHEAANQSAQVLERMLQSHCDSYAVRVTVLDLVDKFLWISDGNPIRLGLA